MGENGIGRRILKGVGTNKNLEKREETEKHGSTTPKEGTES